MMKIKSDRRSCRAITVEKNTVNQEVIAEDRAFTRQVRVRPLG
jgi:hypothetical protein